MLKMPSFDMNTRPCVVKEPIIGPLKSKMAEICHLGSCRLIAKSRFASLQLVLRARHSPSTNRKTKLRLRQLSFL